MVKACGEHKASTARRGVHRVTFADDPLSSPVVTAVAEELPQAVQALEHAKAKRRGMEKKRSRIGDFKPDRRRLRSKSIDMRGVLGEDALQANAIDGEQNTMAAAESQEMANSAAMRAAAVQAAANIVSAAGGAAQRAASPVGDGYEGFGPAAIVSDACAADGACNAYDACVVRAAANAAGDACSEGGGAAEDAGAAGGALQPSSGEGGASEPPCVLFGDALEESDGEQAPVLFGDALGPQADAAALDTSARAASAHAAGGEEQRGLFGEASRGEHDRDEHRRLPGTADCN